MHLSRELMWERMAANDAAYNGKFITGVHSTGIYCLPSCTARRPKPENVVFYSTEEEAKSAGLRACRRCRPDNFYQNHDPDLETLMALMEAARREPGEFADVNALVEASGMGASKFHVLLRKHYHQTPGDILQAARIANACALLADRAMRTTDIGFEVGYESASAFHENFRRLTGMTPGAYQKLGEGTAFTLALPAGYSPLGTLHTLGRDANSTTERVEGRRLVKAIRVEEQAALLHMELCEEAAHCRVEAASGALSATARRAAHRTATRLLSLACDPAPFERKVQESESLGRLITGRKGLRIPLYGSVFESVIWAIVGQQISLPFAYTLRRRLHELCGESAGKDFFTAPTPEAVARLEYADLLPLQFSRSKAAYLIDMARALVSGELSLPDDDQMPVTLLEKRLLGVRGLGPWSVNYILMRGYGYADCVPVGDSGLRAALKRFFALDVAPDIPRVLQLMEPFSPHRSLATYHLWMSLGDEQ